MMVRSNSSWRTLRPSAPIPTGGALGLSTAGRACGGRAGSVPGDEPAVPAQHRRWLRDDEHLLETVTIEHLGRHAENGSVGVGRRSASVLGAATPEAGGAVRGSRRRGGRRWSAADRHEPTRDERRTAPTETRARTLPSEKAAAGASNLRIPPPRRRFPAAPMTPGRVRCEFHPARLSPAMRTPTGS